MLMRPVAPQARHQPSSSFPHGRGTRTLKSLAPLAGPPASTLFLHREKLDSFLPAHLCKRGHGLFAALRGRSAKSGTGEQGLLSAYRQVKEAVGSSSSGHEAALGSHYRSYLLKCHELPFYG